MPRLNAEQKKQIKDLSKATLEEIVLKIAAKDKSIFEFLQINYLDNENAEQELFDKTISDLNGLFTKRYKGFSEQLQLANMLNACIKRINEFTKISKNKVYEADLLMYILDIPFAEGGFDTCFETYDTRTAIILKRLVSSQAYLFGGDCFVILPRSDVIAKTRNEDEAISTRNMTFDLTLVNLLTKKMHQDYLIEYQEKINEYLKTLHRRSRHINTVYSLPESI